MEGGGRLRAKRCRGNGFFISTSAGSRSFFQLGECKLEFEQFKTSQQALMRNMAKRNRKCGHTGEHKGCKQCRVAKLEAQRAWEKDHKALVQGVVSQVRWAQKTLRG